MRTTINLLIVDDNPVDRATYRRYLRDDPHYDYSIREADSIESAMEAWRQSPATAVILDNRLTDGEGLEFMGFLRSRKEVSCAAVLMLTGYGGTDVAVRAMKAGVCEYVPKKQNSPETLQRALHTAIARGQVQRARQAQSEDLEGFAHTVAHDLRSPLATARHFAERLKASCEDRLSPREADLLNAILKSHQRMDDTIAGLLEFCRVGTGESPRSAVNLDSTVAEILGDLDGVIQENDIRVDVEPLPQVYMNRHRVNQLLLNLLSNAIKFRRDSNHRVRISAREHGSHCTITVEDNGIGIASDQPDCIFEPFKRLHTESEFPGNGIGLAICKKIVDQSGGQLRVESQPGSGTRFLVTLPLAEHVDRNGLHTASNDTAMGADSPLPRVRPETGSPVAVEFGDGRRQYRGRVHDLSTSGVGIELVAVKGAEQQWEVDDFVDVVVHFPGHLPLAAQGLVRHQTRNRQSQVLGIQFVDLADGLRNDLGSYVGSHL